jgi:hypothetical protein
LPLASGYRGFLPRRSSNAHERLFVYDKHTDKVFKTSISNAAAENGFYDFEVTASRTRRERSPECRARRHKPGGLDVQARAFP